MEKWYFIFLAIGALAFYGYESFSSMHGCEEHGQDKAGNPIYSCADGRGGASLQVVVNGKIIKLSQ